MLLFLLILLLLVVLILFLLFIVPDLSFAIFTASGVETVASVC